MKLWFSISTLALIFSITIILYSMKHPSYKNSNTSPTTSPAMLTSGETLYRRGDIFRHIPACITCHGSEGFGNAQAGFPVITNQHMLYTINQLKAFKNKSRKNDLHAVMQNIASNMTETDMEAVALYIQNLKPTDER